MDCVLRLNFNPNKITEPEMENITKEFEDKGFENLDWMEYDNYYYLTGYYNGELEDNKLEEILNDPRVANGSLEVREFGREDTRLTKSNNAVFWEEKKYLSDISDEDLKKEFDRRKKSKSLDKDR